MRSSLAMATACMVACASSSPSPAAPPASGGSTDAGGGDAGVAVMPASLPSGAPGVGFDDLRYSATLKKVLVPAGRSGNLDLVDPDTLAVTAIAGFSSSPSFTGGHDQGSTSADEGRGTLYAIDHETQSVRVVDPSTRAIVAMAALAGSPDYLRWVDSTSEIWITEPSTGIEILSTSPGAAPVHTATIAVAGGPEAIAVDLTRKRVYTNSFGGQSFAIDIATRAIVETWSNGCSVLSLGLALDEARGFLFVACSTGTLVVLDAAHGGANLGQVARTTDYDIISFSPKLHHLYAPGGMTGDLAIVGIAASGTPSLLGTVPTVQGSKQVVADDRGSAWVGDPSGGRVLEVVDPYPMTP